MNLNIGTICEVDHKFNPDNLLGIVYEILPDPDYKGLDSVSVILEDGMDLGNFCVNDQLQFLFKVKDTGFKYEFETVVKLIGDFNKGVFKNCFK
jgi:hypothetical protein